MRIFWKSGHTRFSKSKDTQLPTIRNADKIIVIEKGRMIEAGTHEELLRKKGYYYQLYSMQFLKEEEGFLQREKE